MSQSAERVARNEAIFREANEGIREAARELAPAARVPFVCECADTGCRELLRVTLAGYAAVREHSRRFLCAPGHDAAAEAWATVVEEHEHYVVVEKIGEAGEIAEQLDSSERLESEPVGRED